MKKENLEIPEKVLDFICYNVKSNIRELEGILVSLIAQSSLNEREIDIDLAKEVVEKFVARVSKEITLESIQDMVADYFDLDVETLKSKTENDLFVRRVNSPSFLLKNLLSNSCKITWIPFVGGVTGRLF